MKTLLGSRAALAIVVSFGTLACAPALHLREQDEFRMPFVGLERPAAVRLEDLHVGPEVQSRFCVLGKLPVKERWEGHSVFDDLIQEAFAKSHAQLLRDVRITVELDRDHGNDCFALAAVPLFTEP